MLPDVQKMKDGFPKIDIDKVGVENIKAIIPIRTKYGKIQSCLANVSAYCFLSKKYKGINMSRMGRAISEVLSEKKGGMLDLSAFIYKLMDYHENDNASIEAEFIYIVENRTPVSNIKTTKPVKVKMISEYKNGKLENILEIKSTEMSLCPCSKEMSLLKNNLTKSEEEAINLLPEQLRGKILESGLGAHNQKSIICIRLDLKGGSPLIEEVLSIIEKSASSPTYTILKREDEKYVTELSYCGSDRTLISEQKEGGPKFVEDIARCAAEYLDKWIDKRINSYVIEVRNQESIHCEDIQAVAILTSHKE